MFAVCVDEIHCVNTRLLIFRVLLVDAFLVNPNKPYSMADCIRVSSVKDTMWSMRRPKALRSLHEEAAGASRMRRPSNILPTV